MAPRANPNDEQTPSSSERQSLFIIRHGDRWDYAHPEWAETAERRGDPPLSSLGHQQARETGAFLDTVFAEEGLTPDRIIWLSSPFLRTLQTSDDALNAFQKVNLDSVRIHPENSVWEMDGRNGELHASLPPIHERTFYFPRLNVHYSSLFTPTLPEPKSAFLTRCDRAVKALHRTFPYKPRTAIVVVSHAAACVGLARSAANVGLQDINAAGPCGIFRLTRTSETEIWDLDHFSKVGGFNGYTDHLSEKGVHTYPWNHFGDKKVNKGYTGPPVRMITNEM